ncbi:MAG: methyltransferase domain-containing protein [Aureliella sp.]
MKPHSFAALLFCGCFFQVCHGQQTETQTEPTAATQRPAGLPDGINRSFLDPEMKVDDFVKRFEVESREVVACQADILAAIELKSGMGVADIGSGTGLYLAPLSKSVGDSGKVYAVDISPNFVKHLKTRAKDEKLNNVQVILCNDRETGLKPNSVDRAFLCDVYHHFEFPESTLKSILTALRPGGQLILVDFHREIEGERREWMMNHIRAPMETFKKEIVDAGFKFESEVKIDGFKENYLLRFTKAKH